MKLAVFILAAHSVSWASDYRLKNPPDALQIVTPDGDKTIIFETSTGERPKSFRVKIPIEQLRPPPQVTLAAPIVAEPARETTAITVEPPKVLEPAKAADPVKPMESPKPELAYDDTDSLILRANYLFNRGDYFGATLKVDELLKRNPKLTRAWVMKGTLFYVQGFKDLATNAWQKAYELSGQDTAVKELLEKYK